MSEAEKPEPKTGKRIVSKGEYVKVAAAKAGFVFAGKMLQIVGIGCFILGGVATIGWVQGCFEVSRRQTATYFPGNWIVCMVAAIGFGLCTYVFLKLGSASVDKAFDIEQVRLFTRANTADLPAPESLVRASAEPLQAQENVLLRAAAQGSETPAEQLVRPAGGQE